MFLEICGAVCGPVSELLAGLLLVPTDCESNPEVISTFNECLQLDAEKETVNVTLVHAILLIKIQLKTEVESIVKFKVFLL